MGEPDEGGSGAEQDAFAELMGLSLQEVLTRGHEALIRRMVAKAEAGTLTVNEASVLRNLLRDNGMTMGLPPPVKTIDHEPRKALPVFQKPDYEE
jgi:hypothetical protein